MTNDIQTLEALSSFKIQEGDQQLTGEQISNIAREKIKPPTDIPVIFKHADTDKVSRTHAPEVFQDLYEGCFVENIEVGGPFFEIIPTSTTPLDNAETVSGVITKKIFQANRGKNGCYILEFENIETEGN